MLITFSLDSFAWIIIDEIKAITTFSATKNKYKKFDFRNTAWGMSIDEVLAYERLTKGSWLINKGQQVAKTIKIFWYIPVRSLPIIDQNLQYDYLLEYRVEDVASHSMLLRYFFLNNQLIAASYSLTDKIPDNRFLGLYWYYQDVLSTKYGSLKENKKLVKESFKNWAWFLESNTQAVAHSYISYYSRWETDRTEVILTLFGNHEFNPRCNLGIMYKSQKHKELFKATNNF